MPDPHRPHPLAAAAAIVFRDRQAMARRMVRHGRIGAQQAEAQMLPWLAIACRCGAQLAELDEPLAELRVTRIYRGRGLPPEAGSRSDAQARAILADQICPRERWAPLLARARDAAVIAAETDPARRDDARRLYDLAQALAPEIPFNPAPPFLKRGDSPRKDAA